MGGDRSSKSSKSKKKHLDEASGSSSSYSSSESDRSSENRSSRHRHKKNSSRREKEKHEREERRWKRRERRDRKERRKEEKRRLRREERKRAAERDDSSSSESDELELPESEKSPEVVVRYILEKFPDVADDLKQLLQMIDNGQAVDTRGVSNRSLVKLLRKLFLSLSLKENNVGVFLLPPTVCPTLEVVGPIISSRTDQQISHSGLQDNTQSSRSLLKDDSPPRRRVIGPEMPSAELLAAAAKLTEAEAVLREAELEGDVSVFIGPPPPAVVVEAESANEAERFEEVTRIMAVEVDCPYDVLGVNRNMPIDNIKKRYWKLSLMVHPDKCSHPQAQQAFVILNRAFKDLQDPEKRKAMDEKIRLKEEQEELMAELKVQREAAQWRRLQGISMRGDDELLEEVKLPQKRDEWMTTLPPERKPGMTMQSTSFSRTTKEGRGDTSVWTDAPSDRAQKAKMNYLEAYNEASALSASEEVKKRTSSDADLVDKYNQSKRSKSLVQKHQEELASSRSKKKSKQQQQEKEEWVGKHPWKPWDRENDLTAGRQKVNLDSENMAQGLASRFSSGAVQRNFL
ncbi:PREDICTED: uncharacterized protein LOC104596792 [Nelumbo nucifera]|uniref:J domain-containing protein n=2 Tax=Nelumbo nucifera TaxID=4432 RepID=A0A822YYM4_NELNU|nr:PREDICTED: uncharacterized protein LOC104596792 [Nelumbo nucifera]DAD39214.1 TPA_asm: hypothetical protein HUJ06_013537 [Nelumbo nucifera]